MDKKEKREEVSVFERPYGADYRNSDGSVRDTPSTPPAESEARND
jgi:hypothetical protein